MRKERAALDCFNQCVCIAKAGLSQEVASIGWHRITKEPPGRRRQSQGRNWLVGWQGWQGSEDLIELFVPPIQLETRSRSFGAVRGKAPLLLAAQRNEEPSQHRNEQYQFHTRTSEFFMRPDLRKLLEIVRSSEDTNQKSEAETVSGCLRL